MRVLHIIKGLGLAGAETHLIILLAGLREREIDARLMLWVSPTRQADDVMAAAQARGIPVERWIMPGHIAPRFFWRLLRHLRRERPDILHTHLVHAETYGIPAARLAGIQHVVNSSHNDDPFRRSTPFRIWNRLLWRFVSRGIAISGAIKKFLVEVEGAQEDQIQVIHYGLRPSETSSAPNLRAELGLPPSARLIGSVCRLVPQKGLMYALSAFGALAEEFPDLHYAIAGDGPLRGELEAQAKSLGVSERVHFLGWRADAPAVMRNFEVFVAPSLWEGFGLVFLEAMAGAVPILASNISAIPEIVENGTTAFTVPPSDANVLAEALRKLLHDPLLAQQMGSAGRARLETVFSEEAMIEKTAALYKSLMQ
jgi:glycosyltransferase involved in cell wall biosynthesis